MLSISGTQSDSPAPSAAATPRPRIWTVFAGLVLLFVLHPLSAILTVTGIGVWTMLVKPELASNATAFVSALMESPLERAATIAVASTVSVAVPVVLARISSERFADRLQARRSRFGVAAYGAAFVAVLALSEAIQLLVRRMTGGPPNSVVTMSQLFRSADPVVFGILLVAVGLLAPIGEELFFRGYLQTRIRRRWGPAAAVATSALTFGLMHVEPSYIVTAAGIGVGLALMTELAGSLRPAIAIHVTNNIASVLDERWTRLNIEAYPVTTLSTCAVLVATAGWWLDRRQVRPLRMAAFVEASGLELDRS